MYIKTIDFSTYSSIKIGQSEEVSMIEKGDKIPEDKYLIGGANNLLISPNPPQMMMLSKDFSTFEQQENVLIIGAATPTGRILSYAKKHDIAGFEFVAKLPGTLGGMLAMNAGVKAYEVFNILHSIEINGTWITKEEIIHGYRYAKLCGVATSAKFIIRHGFDSELLKMLLNLRSNQPKEPSAGSVFKNPPEDYAGRLIEAVGLKGKEKGGMGWSKVHANFLVNRGEGTFQEAKYLIDLAKSEVKKKFNIILQEEIKVL